jgi:hypothetical protein
MQAPTRSWLRRSVLVACASALLILPGSSAFAQAQTVTETVKNQTETFIDELPCVGQAEITITYNGVFHITETANGTHVTGTLTGTFVADPLDPSLPTYTGRFTQWFGGNDNANMDNMTVTFSVRGRAEDGSRVNFHVVAHVTAGTIDFSTDPPTVVTGVRVEFEKARCA